MSAAANAAGAAVLLRQQAKKKSLDKEVAAATVRVTGTRWCSSCCTHHDAATMKPYRQAGGGVIYRCQRWIEARARHRAAMVLA